MSPLIDHSSRKSTRFGGTDPSVRRQMVRLRQGIDDYERLYSTWQQGRRLRESQAEVRLHVIEAQLARLKASDRMGASCPAPAALDEAEGPVVFSIAAYRRR